MKLAQEDLEQITSRIAPLWSEARGKRFFLTGGTGFFGCWLLESFCHANRTLRLGARMTVLTRDAERFAKKAPHLANDEALEFVSGDVRSFEFPAGPFDYVLHCATSTSGDQGPGLEFFDTIVEGTRRTLEFARQSGAKRFLLASSGAVYGTQPPEVMHVAEDFAGAPLPAATPLAIYAEGKRAAEMLCHLYAQSYGIEPAIARCFAFVGPHLPLDAHFAIGNFIGDQLRGGPITVGGDGTPYRSYMYAGDLAVWLWTLLFHGQSCRAYNVGSDEAVSIREVAHAVADALPPKAEVIIQGTPVAGAKPARYVPSIERARRELGLRCEVGLAEAIRRTARWHGAQKD